MRRQENPHNGAQGGDTELELRKIRYGSGVAYIPGEPGEPCRAREQRHGRMRLLARRTGTEPDWRDKCPMEEPAVEVGVKLKLPANGKEGANIRAKKNVLDKEEAYRDTRPVLPPKRAVPTPDAPGAMRVGAEGALAFGRPAGEFSLGTCLDCRGARLNSTYSKGGCVERRSASCATQIIRGFIRRKITRPRHGAARMGGSITTPQSRAPTSPLPESY